MCVTGKSRGCSRVYDDVSVDANWSFYRSGPLDAVAGAALNATSFDPFTLSAEARLGARWRSGVVAVTFVPQMNSGLSHRDTGKSFLSGGGGTGGGATTTLGNREVLTVPVTVQVQATRQLAVSAGVAISGPLDPPQGGFDDAYTVPVSAAADYAISHALDVGAAFAFTNLGGRDGSWDDRFGKIYARVRW